MPSTGYQLSQIAELVEMILLDVPQRDALIWQRVCRVWRGTILRVIDIAAHAVSRSQSSVQCTRYR